MITFPFTLFNAKDEISIPDITMSAPTTGSWIAGGSANKYGGEPWRAFNNIKINTLEPLPGDRVGWVSNATYIVSSGLPNGSAPTTNGVFGEYMSLNNSSAFSVSTIKLYVRNVPVLATRFIESFQLFGSNDGGTTWTSYHTESNIPLATYTTFTVGADTGMAGLPYQVLGSDAYTTHRIVFTKLFGGQYAYQTDITECELSGIISPV